MSETDDTISAARASIDRVRGVGTPVALPRRRRSAERLFMQLAVVNAAIVLAAGALGLVFPLGLFGALAVLILMIAATCAIVFAPGPRPPSVENLRAAPVKQLPAQTSRWLYAQRTALPAPAVLVADQIGQKLNQLEPQLAALDPETPAAAEIRKLVGEQLPDFVKGYQAVPGSLRAQPRNGKTPDEQLVDGLKVIDEQLADISSQLAQGDLDNLSTRGRYLEIRYRGDDAQ